MELMHSWIFLPVHQPITGVPVVVTPVVYADPPVVCVPSGVSENTN